MSFPIHSLLFPTFSFSVPIYTWIRNSHVFPCSFLSISTFLFFISHIHAYLKIPCLFLYLLFSFYLPISGSWTCVCLEFLCLFLFLPFSFHLSLYQPRICAYLKFPSPSHSFLSLAVSVPEYSCIWKFHVFLWFFSFLRVQFQFCVFPSSFSARQLLFTISFQAFSYFFCYQGLPSGDTILTLLNRQCFIPPMQYTGLNFFFTTHDCFILRCYIYGKKAPKIFLRYRLRNVYCFYMIGWAMVLLDQKFSTGTPRMGQPGQPRRGGGREVQVISVASWTLRGADLWSTERTHNGTPYQADSYTPRARVCDYPPAGPEDHQEERQGAEQGPGRQLLLWEPATECTECSSLQKDVQSEHCSPRLGVHSPADADAARWTDLSSIVRALLCLLTSIFLSVSQLFICLLTFASKLGVGFKKSCNPMHFCQFFLST